MDAAAMSVEFVRYADGSCCLTDEAGEMLWSSDNDDDFQEEFGESIDGEEIDDVLAYLDEAGYMDEDESIDVVDEGDEGMESAEKEEAEEWLH
jgi:hypothetical protein